MAEMTKLRVNEAIARAQTAGIKVYKKEVAARLWEDAPKAHNKLI